MRVIICLVGLISLIGTSGCVIRAREHRGGVYDEHYRYYGREQYPYYHDRDRDHGRYWERRY